MTIDDLIRDTGRMFGIENLALDGNACAIKFDDATHVELRYIQDADLLCVASPLGSWTASEKTGIFNRLLRANAADPDLNGSCFALDMAGQCLALCRTEATPMATPESVLECITILKSQQQHWRDDLIRRGWLAH